MVSRKISDSVASISAIDWDRRLFDSLIPLPNGTSYNCYVINGRDKNVLIDTIDPSMSEALDDVTGPIDYIVSHHSEQDHSGSIPAMLARWPDAKVIVTPKGATMLKGLLDVPEDNLMPVDDNFELDLGGKTLKFMHMPWIHWPETMISYLKEDKMLFTCDLFGSHLATSDLYAGKSAKVIDAAKMYYAEIMMPFRSLIHEHLKKIPPADFILPSHGPIHNSPDMILSKYDEWVNDDPRNKVVVAYVSMHGSTRKMVNHLVEALEKRDVPVEQYDMVHADLGKLASDLVDAATLIVGTPVVLGGPHPLIVSAAYLVNALKPKVRHASFVGSYGWSSRLEEQIPASISRLKVELFQPVLGQGVPKAEQYAALERLADDIEKAHRENGYV